MLEWVGDGAGGWHGRLPRWAFQRTEPDGLARLIPEGMLVHLKYSHAYPMVAPAIHPLDPAPPITEWTVHDWHVNGDGSLCLLQAESLWTPRDSVVDLLLKAVGWRVEYALMKVGAISAMSTNGIVSDASYDGLVTDAAAALASDSAR